MTQCFKDHECDDQELHKNTKPISECKSYFTEENGGTTKLTEVPILTCECIWRSYQKESEDIVALGGTLIADPVARNKRINAAYATLWLHTTVFSGRDEWSVRLKRRERNRWIFSTGKDRGGRIASYATTSNAARRKKTRFIPVVSA